MYLDSAYVVKYYVNEPDAPAVRAAIEQASGGLVTSAWAIGEASCAIRRHMSEGKLDKDQVQELIQLFLDHVDSGLWTIVPVTERLLRKVAAVISVMPPGLHMRAGDAIHLVTAQDVGEREIWTSDRHVLQGASHFGLVGRMA